MKVMRASRFGGPEVLEPGEAPDPVAGAGELVVDVAVAEILFLDTQLRAGWGGEYFELEPPYVPGCGVAGTVSSVGDGVDEDWIGRRVVAETGQTGAYAERAAVPADRTFAVPDGLGLRAAIAALHDGLMALDLLEKADVEAGRRVLVNAAGGGIGIWLVPLLNAAGARVIATAGSEPKLELARERGAELVADYSRPGWDQRVRDRLDGDGVHVVFDGAGGEIGRAAFDLTERGGRFFAYGAADGEFADFAAEEAQRREIALTGIDDDIDPEARPRLIERALSELATERIAPVVGQALPLERAAEAHAALAERRVTGKSLLLVGEEA